MSKEDDVDDTIKRLLKSAKGDLAQVEHEVYEHSYNISRAALLLCFDRAEDLEISSLVSVAMLHRLTIHALKDLEKANRAKIREALSLLTREGGRPATKKAAEDLHQAIMRRIFDVTDRQVKKHD